MFGCAAVTNALSNAAPGSDDYGLVIAWTVAEEGTGELQIETGGLRRSSRVSFGRGRGSPRQRNEASESGGGGRFSCKICPYSSNNAANLQRHVRVHTGEKPFKCSYCPAAFSQSGNYKRHLRNHGTNENIKQRPRPTIRSVNAVPVRIVSAPEGQ